METCDNDMIAKEAKAHARDVSRFRTLFPNGEAKLRENPTQQFEFLNAAEMIAVAESVR